jgi:hypothetical protein
MKKQTILIDVHSILDVITNSSTELFITDATKSIETVKEILQVVLDRWNDMAAKGFFGDHYVRNKRYALGDNVSEPKPIKTFEDTFGEIKYYTKEEYEKDFKDIEEYRERNKRNGRDGFLTGGWGYEKAENIGKLMIFSESDNSIPYEMFDWIENIFGSGTTRFHLG